ncbi:MAG: NAD(P)-binding domain-containing protein, partial [Candidatus Rokuibacteriota bacterium]
MPAVRWWGDSSTATIRAAPDSCPAPSSAASRARRRPASDHDAGGSNVTTRWKIGFVGLGTMGGPMAKRLAAGGHEVTGYDLSADRARQAAEAGVLAASSPAAAAK